jgi:phage terminase Nu1 subunit (DNA packaging protein)
MILMNRSELSTAFSVSPSTIDNYVKAGMPCFKKAAGRGAPAEFDLVACIAWIRFEKDSSGPDYFQL